VNLVIKQLACQKKQQTFDRHVWKKAKNIARWLKMLKMFHLTKCNFSTTDSDFLPKFQDLQLKEFSTIPENFSEIFSLLQE